VAGTWRVGFIDIEGLKSKLKNTCLLDLLRKNDMMHLAESCRGLEKFEIKGNKSFNLLAPELFF